MSRQKQPVPQSQWEKSNKCAKCGCTVGTFLSGKHHCRWCGRVFCDKDSLKRVILPPNYAQPAQRVCDRCYVSLDQMEKSGPSLLVWDDGEDEVKVSKNFKSASEIFKSSINEPENLIIAVDEENSEKSNLPPKNEQQVDKNIVEQQAIPADVEKSKSADPASYEQIEQEVEKKEGEDEPSTPPITQTTERENQVPVTPPLAEPPATEEPREEARPTDATAGGNMDQVGEADAGQLPAEQKQPEVEPTEVAKIGSESVGSNISNDAPEERLTTASPVSDNNNNIDAEGVMSKQMQEEEEIKKEPNSNAEEIPQSPISEQSSSISEPPQQQDPTTSIDTNQVGAVSVVSTETRGETNSVNQDSPEAVSTVVEGSGNLSTQPKFDADSVLEALLNLVVGTIHSLYLGDIYRYHESKNIRERMRDTLALNVLLLVTYWWYRIVVIPAMATCSLYAANSFTIFRLFVWLVNWILSLFYWSGWLAPIFVLSCIFNLLWCQSISDSASLIHLPKHTQRRRARRVQDVVSEAIYRAFMFNSLLGLSFLCCFIPYVGRIFYFVVNCWIFSVYAFEYRWNQEGWSFAAKSKCFHRCWVYFIGYGLIITASSFFFDVITSSCISALMFPLLILIAMEKEPQKHSSWHLPIAPFIEALVPQLLSHIKGGVNSIVLRLVGAETKTKKN
jgi:hypothetical protein